MSLRAFTTDPEAQGYGAGVDEDELDEHEFEPLDIKVTGDGFGPLGPYFEALLAEAHRCAEVARQARGRGYDPALEPEIPFAQDLASRVEALVGPEGVAARIRELAREMGREELALVVSKEVAAGRFGDIGSTEDALDQSIRTGLAILTEGILVAPLEGVAYVKVRPNDDGSSYADVYFAGPIRAAGGTGQALSVLIADVVRRELGLGRYRSTREEVERFKEEIPAYKRAANLQYTPGPEEIELIVSNLPVGVNGEGTDREEVSGYRDLPRVETNQLRGGACLVLAEGLTLKAPKILKHVDKLGLEGWGFLQDYLDAKKAKDAKDASGHGEGDAGVDGSGAEGGLAGPRITPVTKYITELVAGRPVFAHPSRPGGFRLRYGRARTAGLASTALHPALMPLVDDFLAVGTQLKVERPGKGTVATPCDELEPPIVRLEDGSVIEVTSCRQAERIRSKVRSILDLGEMLVPFGEFLENNKRLAAAAWCPEWWRQRVERAGHDGPVPDIPDDRPDQAFELAEATGTPLHPRFTLMWHDIDRSGLEALVAAVGRGTWRDGRLVLADEGRTKTLLEMLGATHRVASGGGNGAGGGRGDGGNGDGSRGASGPVLVLDVRTSMPVLRGTGHDIEAATGAITLVRELPAEPVTAQGMQLVELVSQVSGVRVMAKAPCRIGARMGRPEKAAERKMNPPVHTLFPLGGAGGSQRLIKQAAAMGSIGTTSEDNRDRHKQIEVGVRVCPKCQEEMLFLQCRGCGETTRPAGKRPHSRVIPLRELVDDALARLGEGKYHPNTKGVQGLISEHKTPEPLEKGFLRSKHDVFVFKDGTCRFDMTDVPLTHFRPREIKAPVDKLVAMGYTHDIHGEPLTADDQVLELRPQDIVLNEDGLKYMARVAQFVDDLLVRLYGLKPYYNVREPEDLVGHLAVGLAPHTSGGVLCRIIGTTRAQIHYGHPYFHAAKRRNCFHGDTEILVRDDDGPRKVRLRDLVEPAMADGHGRPVDAHGTEVATPDGVHEVVSLDPATRAPRNLRITKLVRGTTDAWIDLGTSTHRRMRVTPDHEVLVRRDGRLVTVRAAKVEHGDQVPVGLSLPRDPVVPTFDLARLLAPLAGTAGDGPVGGSEGRPDVRLRGIDGWLRDRVEAIGRDTGLEVCQPADRLARTPSRWFRAFPLVHYRALVEAGLATWDELPEQTRLGIARDKVELPSRLPVTPELCRLIGLYLAEGHARSNAAAHRVSWRNTDPAIADDIAQLVREVFGRQPNIAEGGSKITLSSRLVFLLFTEVWQARTGAHEKRLPGWCFDLPEAHMVELVAGYFDGDGSVLHDPARLRFYSANLPLLEDIALVLQALGLFTRFVPGKPRPPGSFLRARYKELGQGAPDTLGPVHALALMGEDIKRFAALVTARHPEKRHRLHELVESGLEGRLLQVDGRKVDPEPSAHCLFDRIVHVERVELPEPEATYCIDVSSGSDELATKNVLLGNGLYQVRCDGDEDCVMLLLDGLLNFSRDYLPRTRGGQMDAPLTLSTRIDPREIDKEAHNIDVMWQYPLEFYEATYENPTPKEVEDLIETVAARLGGERQYTEIGYTHDTGWLDEGPKLSAYKTIGTMLEKMEGQLRIGARIRAVDEADVASRVICDHFLPDIVGNLKAFSRQVVRCAKCNTKYRRIPLTGRCTKCKNKLTMTVHEASVKKYIQVSKKVAQQYNVDDYTLQRLRLAEDAIDSLFQNDKVKKSTLADFL